MSEREPASASEARRDARGRTHASRVDESAEEHATHQEAETPWVRPSSLDAPLPRPGMVQRWIRVSLRGADDPRNRNKKTREGWTPRPMSSIPAEWRGLATVSASVDGAFVVDDLVLCEMPKAKYEQRRAYYQSLTDKQMEAVEVELERSQVPGHRIERKHKSEVSHPARRIGRRAEAAPDIE